MLPQCEGGKEDGLDTKVKQNIDLNKAEPGRERRRVEIPKVSFWGGVNTPVRQWGASATCSWELSLFRRYTVHSSAMGTPVWLWCVRKRRLPSRTLTRNCTQLQRVHSVYYTLHALCCHCDFTKGHHHFTSMSIARERFAWKSSCKGGIWGKGEDSRFRRYTLYSATMETMHHGNRLDGRLAYRTLAGRCTPSVQTVYSVHSPTIGVPVLFYVTQMKD